jgi:hypothetical protein
VIDTCRGNPRCCLWLLLVEAVNERGRHRRLRRGVAVEASIQVRDDGWQAGRPGTEALNPYIKALSPYIEALSPYLEAVGPKPRKIP